MFEITIDFGRIWLILYESYYTHIPWYTMVWLKMPWSVLMNISLSIFYVRIVSMIQYQEDIVLIFLYGIREFLKKWQQECFVKSVFTFFGVLIRAHPLFIGGLD